MLTVERIEPGVAGVDAVVLEVDSAGAEEERSGAAPQRAKLQIDWGAEFLGV